MGSAFPTYPIRFVLFHRYLFNSEWLTGCLGLVKSGLLRSKPLLSGAEQSVSA